jgi:hypothetical protein
VQGFRVQREREERGERRGGGQLDQVGAGIFHCGERATKAADNLHRQSEEGSEKKEGEKNGCRVGYLITIF